MKVVTINGSFIRGHGIDTSIFALLRKIHDINPTINLELICNVEDGLIKDGFPEDIPKTVLGRRMIFGYYHLNVFDLVNSVSIDGETVIHAHHPLAVWALMAKRCKRIVTWHGNNNVCWNDQGFGPLHKRISIV